MAKQRIFPEPLDPPDDTRKPHERFSDLASLVVRVPKAQIDEREQQWKRSHHPRVVTARSASKKAVVSKK